VEIFKTGKTENVNFLIKNFNHCKFKFVLMLTKFVMLCFNSFELVNKLISTPRTEHKISQ